MEILDEVLAPDDLALAPLQAHQLSEAAQTVDILAVHRWRRSWTVAPNVVFEGEDRGTNLILTLNIVVDQEGVYWFDVLLEDELLTRIPLRILYQRIGQSI